MHKRKECVVIVAGGLGLRAGGDIPKQFQILGDEPLLMHTINAFYDYNNLIRIILVIPAGYETQWREMCEQYNFNVPFTTVEGGDTRFHSVRNGLTMVDDDEIVAIHDAARPFVTPDVITQAFNEAYKYKCGVIPVIEGKNSLRMLTETGSIPVDRTKFQIVQTPQVFPAALLKKAYHTSYIPTFTDDASVAEAYGISIRLIPGNEMNIKITTPLDFMIGTFILRNI